jgi:hypothetical protein
MVTNLQAFLKMNQAAGLSTGGDTGNNLNIKNSIRNSFASNSIAPNLSTNSVKNESVNINFAKDDSNNSLRYSYDVGTADVTGRRPLNNAQRFATAVSSNDVLNDFEQHTRQVNSASVDSTPAQNDSKSKIYGTNPAEAINGENQRGGNFDPSNSSKPFNGQWQDFQAYRQYWHGKGGYISETGDYIDKNVMFRVHEYPGGKANVDEETWKGINEKIGFLFKDDEGSAAMNEALGKTKEQLDRTGLGELARDSWTMAMLTANKIDDKDLQGKLGEQIKYDADFRTEWEGKRSGAYEGALHDQMHQINSGNLNKVAQLEGINIGLVNKNLEALGHDTSQLTTMNYRALMESSKNYDLISNPDAFASKVKEHFDQHGFLPKFDLSIHYLMSREGDTMAFADAFRGMEQGSQSMLKGVGNDIKFSADANATNKLFFGVVGEGATENLIDNLRNAFKKAGLNSDQILNTYGDSEATQLAAKNGVLSGASFDLSMHGGKDGTGLNKAGITSLDETKLDLGGQDKNIMIELAAFNAENGGDRMIINADSCHGHRHGEKAAIAFAQGTADYDKANGTSSKVQVTHRGVDTFGTADAQQMGSKNGYITYKFDATGAAALEYVYSSDQRVEGQGPTIGKDLHYDGSGTFRGGNDEDSKQKFFDSVSEQAGRMNQFLESAAKKDYSGGFDFAVSNNKSSFESASQASDLSSSKAIAEASRSGFESIRPSSSLDSYDQWTKNSSAIVVKPFSFSNTASNPEDNSNYNKEQSKKNTKPERNNPNVAEVEKQKDREDQASIA